MQFKDITPEIIQNLVKCGQCGNVQGRPAVLTMSTFAECPFICENCRCKDCSIVLNIQCDCGETHAEPSQNDPRMCAECAIIRQRVSNLDTDLLRLRNMDISREGSVYGNGKRSQLFEDDVENIHELQENI